MTHDMSAPLVEEGLLLTRATGSDPFITHEHELGIQTKAQSKYLVIEMASDRAGVVQVFWVAEEEVDFTEQNSMHLSVNAQGTVMTIVCRLTGREL